MPHPLPDDVKKRAEKKCADRYQYFEVQDPGHVWTSPSGKMFVFVVDNRTSSPNWIEVPKS